MRSWTDPAALWQLSCWLYQRGHARSAKLLKLLNYVCFSCVLPVECVMAARPAMMHRGLGVVVHPSTRLGRNVYIGHGVTIAASPPDDQGETFPVIIGDDVFIGAQAILMARRSPLRIERGAGIGAGSVVLSDVPVNGQVRGNPARLVESLT